MDRAAHANPASLEQCLIVLGSGFTVFLLPGSTWAVASREKKSMQTFCTLLRHHLGPQHDTHYTHPTPELSPRSVSARSPCGLAALCHVLNLPHFTLKHLSQTWARITFLCSSEREAPARVIKGLSLSSWQRQFKLSFYQAPAQKSRW